MKRQEERIKQMLKLEYATLHKHEAKTKHTQQIKERKQNQKNTFINHDI